MHYPALNIMQADQDITPLLTALKVVLNQLQFRPQSLKQAQQVIRRQGRDPQFIHKLLRIINSPNISNDPNQVKMLTVLSLSQLKCYIRQYWPHQFRKNSQFLISQHAQQFLKENILYTMDNLCDHYQYAQLLLDVAQLIGHPLCKFLLGDPTLTKALQTPGNIMGCLWILLGVAKSYQHSGSLQSFMYYQQLLNPLFTYLLYIEDNLNLEEIGKPFIFQYLCIKFVTKSMNSQMSINLKVHSFRWALKNQHQSQFPNISWNDLTKGQKNYFDYHTYKWKIKFLEKFVMISLKNIKIADQISHECNIIVDRFMRQSFWSFVQIICHQLEMPSFDKIKYHQLKLLSTIVTHKHSYFFSNPEKSSVIQIIIMPLLLLSKENLKDAKQDPTRFTQMESNIAVFETLLESSRHVGIELWQNILKLGLENPKDPLGKQIIQHSFMIIKKLVSLLQKNQQLNLQEHLYVEVGLKLVINILYLSGIKYIEDYYTPYLKMVPQFMDGFQNGYYGEWIAIRAVQIFGATSYQYERQQIIYIREWIFDKILNYPSLKEQNLDLLLIKCCLSFDRLMSYSQCSQELTDQRIKYLFRCFLQIVQQYDSEEIIYTLKKMVMNYGSILQEELIIVAQQLRQRLMEYIEKDRDQTNSLKYENILHQTSDTLVMVLKILVKDTNTMDKNIMDIISEKVEQIVLNIFQTILQGPKEEYQYYLDITEPVLSTYLSTYQIKYRSADLSKYLESWQIKNQFRMDVLYKTLIFRIIGLPSEIQQSVRLFPESLHHSMLMQCMGVNLYGLQTYARILRAFILITPINQSVRELQQIRKNITDANNLELLFLLVGTFIKNQSKQSSGKILALLVLTYLLQVNKENIYPQLQQKVYHFIILTFPDIIKQPCLTKYVLQLYCLWAHLQSQQMLIHKLFELDNRKRQRFFALLFHNNDAGLNQLAEQIQFKRVILGLVKILKVLLLKIPDLNLSNFFDVIICWIIYFQYMILEENGIIYSQDEPNIEVKFPEAVDDQQQEKNEENQFERQKCSFSQCIDEFYQQKISMRLVNDCFLQVMSKFYSDEPQLYFKIVINDDNNNDQILQILFGLNIQNHYSFLANFKPFDSL